MAKKSSKERIRLARIFEIHWAVTALMMMVSTIFFAGSSYNLYMMFEANIRYISEHGRMAILDDGALQFLVLCFNAAISAFSYVMFKACEQVLVEKVLK